MNFSTRFGVSAKTQLIRAAIWTAISLFWLDLSWDRVAAPRAAGRHVPTFRYAQLVFWAGILAFWMS